MKPSETLLEAVLTGDDIPDRLLDQVLEGKEDQYLDFKDWKKGERKKFSDDLRKYVAGFANSDGGVILIGFNENSREVTGCGDGAEEWVSRSLRPIASYLSPSPRFRIVQARDQDILLVGVSRAPSLVPVIESGRQVFYFRFHDQTLNSPDFLISDLVLGRRQQPNLEIRAFSITCENAKSASGLSEIRVQFSVLIANEGFVNVESIQSGIVYWKVGTSVWESEYLKASIDAVEPNTDPLQHSIENCRLSTAGGSVTSGRLFPFQGIKFRNSEAISIPDIHHTWNAALYILPVNHRPIWYQLMCRITGQPFSPHPEIKHEKIFDRPLVSLDGFRIG